MSINSVKSTSNLYYIPKSILNSLNLLLAWKVCCVNIYRLSKPDPSKKHPYRVPTLSIWNMYLIFLWNIFSYVFDRKSFLSSSCVRHYVPGDLFWQWLQGSQRHSRQTTVTQMQGLHSWAKMYLCLSKIFTIITAINVLHLKEHLPTLLAQLGIWQPGNQTTKGSLFACTCTWHLEMKDSPHTAW